MYIFRSLFDLAHRHAQIPNYRGGKNREDAVDRPATWEEVAFKVVPLQEGEEDVNEVHYYHVLHTFELHFVQKTLRF